MRIPFIGKKKELPPEAEEPGRVEEILGKVKRMEKRIERPASPERNWKATAKSIGSLGGGIGMKPGMKKYYIPERGLGSPSPTTMIKGTPQINHREWYLPTIKERTQEVPTGNQENGNLQLVYDAYQNNIPQDQMPVVTGLTEQEVSYYLQVLKKKGAIQEELL